MSDFGFDAYALDDAEPTGHPHPLEIARDLIATGDPRAALEMLSSHHDEFADDPEYLLLCSAAWRADGDGLRAQQALLGAARLAPEDPRPLLWLADLLEERGEHGKAERILEKAHALEAAAAKAETLLEDLGPDVADDLIAFAELQERKSQARFTPRQILLVVLAVVAFALLIFGISTLTSTEDAPPTGVASGSSDDAVLVGPEEAAPAEPVATETVEPVLVRNTVPDSETLEALPGMAPSTVAPTAPLTVTPPAAAEAVKPPPPAAKPPRRAKPSPSRKVVAEPTPEPDVKVVEAELASWNTKQLTVRADALYAQGHTGVAASYYRRALELDPDYAPALVGMGQSILRAKKYSDAMENATRALQLARGVDARPGLEAAALYQMGRVHYERGERDAARQLFRQSISLAGTPPDAWFYLGEALSSDNSPAARAAYENYLELVSDGHLAERARRAIQ